MAVLKCRFCGTDLTNNFINLGATPLANSYLSCEEVQNNSTQRYPLNVWVCSECLLVQAEAPVSPAEIFTDYAYFSSYSDSWVAQEKEFAKKTVKRFDLSKDSFVVEVASNDGYLLQHFIQLGINVLGIEPAKNVAETAIDKGIPTHIDFFNVTTAKLIKNKYRKADLMIAKNVIAHVPNIGHFINGFSEMINDNGVIIFEFPHILNLIEKNQFDTIYHEHFSYLSIQALENILNEYNLNAFDIEELSSHGGSLRVYVSKTSSGLTKSLKLKSVVDKEKAHKLHKMEGYLNFSSKVEAVASSFKKFLDTTKLDQKKLAAYGAAAKGNTFLNYCKVTSEDIMCVFERSPQKIGKYMPGSNIPILHPDKISEMRPDYILILPWNLEAEVCERFKFISQWDGKFVTAIPETRVIDP